MKRRIFQLATGLLFALGLCSFGLSPFSFADEIQITSKITEVTVYPGSARVTRQAKVDLSAGGHNIVLKDIVSEIDENSLMVSGQGKAKVKIYGAYVKKEHNKDMADERVRQLTDLIEQLSDQIQMENQKMDVALKEAAYLDSIKLFSGSQLPKDLITVMPPVDKLEEIRQFLSEKYSDLEKRKEAIRINIRRLNIEKQVAQRNLNELRSFGSELQLKFVVDLECTKPGTIDLNVSYLVYGAYWRSIYDARIYKNKEQVELTAYGLIKQTTGEDWSDVRLFLSTARPTVSGRMPDVVSWILHPYEPRQRAAQAPMAIGKVMREGAPQKNIAGQIAGYMDDMDALKSAEMDSEAQLAYSQVEQKGISIVYNIARPASVKSDGTEYKYPIASQALKADFEYSTYPRILPSAYLGSRVDNSEELQLLAGQVNLFLEDDYIGKSSIDDIGPGEKFNLYLGVDENVKVKREQISRKVDDVLLGGIKSPNRKTFFEYKITVENYKSNEVKVNLYEAIPVSEDERIKVKTADVSVKPKDVDWKERKGIWRWEFKLKPKEKKEITYSFSVDHPRDINIPGI